jgi:hypothetical protein
VRTLTGREDANTQIAIAVATKRDSSDMKVIAVVTMAFLPATFFAALFQQPTLHFAVPDDATNIITEYFWLYLVFTIPTTALVFGLWFLFNSRWMRSQAGAIWKRTSWRLRIKWPAGLLWSKRHSPDVEGGTGIARTELGEPTSPEAKPITAQQTYKFY